MSNLELVEALTRRAQTAARRTAELATDVKNAGLECAAAELEARSAEVLGANARDLDAARRAGVEGAMLERLMLDRGRVRAMAEGLRAVAALPDPVGEITRMSTRPSGLQA